MPIFEYICRDCQHHFEAIVTPSRPAVCPGCQGLKLDKQHSVFAVAAKGTSQSISMPASGGCGACGDPRGPGSCRLD